MKSDYNGCMACSPNPHISALRARAEQAERSAAYWEEEAKRYAQNVGHHEERAEQAERDADECRKVFGGAPSPAKRELDALRSRVLALAEEYKWVGEIDGSEITLALREAVEGK